MMSTNLKSIRTVASNANVVSRCLASHATASKSATKSTKPGEIKVSTLPSGTVLASVASDSPMARIAVVMRAGSRYEPKDQLGLTHILRSAAGLTTERYTNFGITRNIEYFGGRLSVNGTRDTISYLLEVHNDEDILERNFAMLADTLSKPTFKAWELADNTERIEADLTVVADTPYIQLAEALHAVAFKGGLRNSLYVPKFMLGKHKPEQLKKYVENRFVTPVVVGVGLEHQELVELVGANLTLSSHQPSKCQSKFIGGETHIDSASPLTYVALATEGAGLKNTKESLALSLFQTVLGSGPQIKNSYGLSSVSRLGKTVSGAAQCVEDVAVSAFNFAYEETGLFGINLIAPASSDVTGLVKTAMKEFRAAAGSITDAELADAKRNFKTAALIAADSGDSLALELGQQLALIGSTVDVVKQVDSITAADVKAVAGKMLKGKLALVTLGRNAPYLDDIAA